MNMLAMLVLSVIALPLPASAQAISGEPYVAVHGEAKAEVVPDVFPLKVALTETSLDTARTQTTIESLARRIVELAETQGVSEEDLTVGNLDVSPEFKYDERKEEQVFLGNTYEREIRIRFHSLDALQSFLGKLPEARQVQVGTESFQYSRTAESRRALLSNAIANARGIAEQMASGAGRKLGPVHTISNQGFNLRYSESVGLDTVTVSGNGVALLAPGTVVLKEGRITLDQDVYIVYRLVD